MQPTFPCIYNFTKLRWSTYLIITLIAELQVLYHYILLNTLCVINKYSRSSNISDQVLYNWIRFPKEKLLLFKSSLQIRINQCVT